MSVESSVLRATPAPLLASMSSLCNGLICAGFIAGWLALRGQAYDWPAARTLLQRLGCAVVACALVNIVVSYRRSPESVFVTWLRRFNGVYCRWYHRMRVQHGSRIPGTGGCIVVCNHTSFMDPPFLQTCCPRRLIHFLIAREYYELPVLNTIFRRIQLIPVNRTGTDVAATKTALRVLKRGGVIGIFPEGRINESSVQTLQNAQQGTALLALRSRVPVIPAFVTGTSFSSSIAKDLLFTRARAGVAFGPPVPLEDLYERSKTREALEIAMDRITSAIVDLRQSAERMARKC